MTDQTPPNQPDDDLPTSEDPDEVQQEREVAEASAAEPRAVSVAFFT